jgi:hypothetical protein
MSQTKRRKRFGRGRSVNEEMTLQITSMADVFTIILVFILKSSSMGVSNVSVSNGTKLPSAVHSEAMVEKLKLEISPDAVILDGEPVAKLDKSETEMIYVALKEFKGHKLVDVRTYFRPQGATELVPSQKGVAFKFSMLDEVREALKKVKEMVK